MENITIYSCEEPNTIVEISFDDLPIYDALPNKKSGFLIIEKFDFVYQRELHRFIELKSNPAYHHAYAHPLNDEPKNRYLGICPRVPPEEYFPTNFPSKNNGEDFDSVADTENEALTKMKMLKSPNNYDLVWYRLLGASKETPNGYYFIGYDVNYPPSEIYGSFSIINDCMFICQYHFCDEEGTAFIEYFNQLNVNGLFENENVAISYMKHYLSFEWAETGDYCICEVYRKMSD